MKGDQDQPISLYQSFALIVGTVVGVGVLGFQRGVVKEVGPNGVWTILIGGLIVVGEVFLITWVMQQFPHKNVVQLSGDLLGKRGSLRLGKVLSLPILLALSVYWLSGTAIVARIFGEVLISAIFPRTPMEVIIGILIGSVVIVASQKPQLIARFCEFLLPFLILPGGIIVVTLFQGMEWENFLPLGQVSWNQVVRGLITSSFSFSGFSVIFMYMGDYQQPQKAMGAHLLATLTVIIGYWFTLVASIGMFGREELAFLMWPTLDLAKQVQIPGQILTRLEAPILSIWVVAVFTTMVSLLGALVNLGINYFDLKEHQRKWVAWGAAPVLFWLAFRPSDLQEVFRWNDWAGVYALITTTSVVLILLGAAWVRSRKRGESDASSSS